MISLQIFRHPAFEMFGGCGLYARASQKLNDSCFFEFKALDSSGLMPALPRSNPTLDLRPSLPFPGPLRGVTSAGEDVTRIRSKCLLAAQVIRDFSLTLSLISVIREMS